MASQCGILFIGPCGSDDRRLAGLRALGFRVDNIHWAGDGSLFAAGQAQQGWKAVKIDPSTLAVRDVLVQADTPEFNAGTALAEVGDTLWVGSFRGNRIVIVPNP